VRPRTGDKVPVRVVMTVIAASLILAGVTGCNGNSNTQLRDTLSDIVVTDDTGTTYNFEEPVATIVSLAPSNTEIVFFVEAGDKLIGRTDYCNYPAEVSSIESVGDFSDPNKEKIVLLDPDVVLATDIQVSSGDVAWLEEQGLRVVVLYPGDVYGILDNIMLVGQLTGNEDIASEKIAGLEARINYVTYRTATITEGEKPRVLHVTWHVPLWTVGSDNFLNTVIEMAGGTNIFTDVSGDVQVDIEQAVTRNPQVITVVTGHGDAMSSSYDYVVAEDSPYNETDAYKNGRIFLIDADIASRQSPRVVEALELFAEFFYPEIFS